MSLFLAIMTRFADDVSLAIKLTLYPLAACFVVFPIVYIAGFLLNSYYNTYRTFVHRLSLTKDEGE